MSSRILYNPITSHLVRSPLEAWIVEFTTGKNIGIVSLDNNVFGSRPRLDILQRVVTWQLAKRRAGTAKVKDRSEVSGGGRKPWPQKGFGRARQGSIRAPQWRGGGVVHGPRGNKSYDYTLPKRVRQLGLRTALSVKYGQGDLFIVDSLTLNDYKTKSLLNVLDIHKWKSVLFVDGGDTIDTSIALASQNLQEVDVLPTLGLNVYSILKRQSLVLTIGAVKLLEERLNV